MRGTPRMSDTLDPAKKESLFYLVEYVIMN